MIENLQIRLARANDAEPIASLSRHAIEHGLPWRWTPERVLRSIHDRESNVVVAREGNELTGFGIMKYRDDDAHLFLLAVHPARRRHGVGAALMRWLEATALTAGIGFIRLEARAHNDVALNFYASLGYIRVGTMKSYYPGGEDAAVLEKRLTLTLRQP